jgi:Uma2 family endonuclease
MAKRASDPEAEPRPMSVEEYLRFEAAAETKHEYVAGEVYAMWGVRRRHARIVTNLVHRLAAAVGDGPCEVISVDVKLRAANDRIYYPDLMVLCTPGDDDDLVLDDPSVIVEVTSPSTARTDRGEKLDAYRKIPSLRGYLVVDHRGRRVDRHWRDAEGAWHREDVVGEGNVAVPCPELSLSLDEIYRGVESFGVREEVAASYGAETADA